MINIIYPYYSNAQMLSVHVCHWCALPEDLRKKLHFIIVDDGSPLPLRVAPPYIIDGITAKNAGPRPHKINLDVYRIKEDIPWNVSGAKNLGAHVAETDWMLIIDMDYFLDVGSLYAIADQLDRSDPKTYYRFKSVSVSSHNLDEKEIWSTLFINRNSFWKIGGYDESFAGSWAYEDVDFCHRATMAGGLKEVVLDTPTLTSYTSKEIKDSECLTVDRKSKRNSKRMESRLNRYRWFMEARKANPHAKPDQGSIFPTEHLRFEWKKVQEFRLNSKNYS